VAAALDVRRVLVPVGPGVFTAVGMLASDVTHHFVRAAGGALRNTRTLDGARIALEELAAEALATLAGGEGYPRERVEIAALADLRYAGQASELVVPIPAGRLERAHLDDLRDAFDREYAATYGYSTDEPLELVNVRVVATGRREHRLDFRSVRVVGTPQTVTRNRVVHWAGSAPPIATPVVGRSAIAREPTAGPLVVEEYDSTVVVPPGATVHRDPFGNLVLTLAPRP
jgi:N-methylhydantoinase A